MWYWRYTEGDPECPYKIQSVLTFNMASLYNSQPNIKQNLPENEIGTRHRALHPGKSPPSHKALPTPCTHPSNKSPLKNSTFPREHIQKTFFFPLPSPPISPARVKSAVWKDDTKQVLFYVTILIWVITAVAVAEHLEQTNQRHTSIAAALQRIITGQKEMTKAIKALTTAVTTLTVAIKTNK